MVFSPLRFKIHPPKDVTAVIASTVHLPCVAESDLKTTITWTKDSKTALPMDSTVLLNGTLVLSDVKKSQQGSYTCRATNAVKTIEAKVKIKPITIASCSVIRKYDSRVSGNYVIDPDGDGGLAQFTVFCDMIDKNGVGVTVISHDSEGRTKVRDIYYTGASLSQLASLTRASSHCEQIIAYGCYNSRLLISGMGWWVSRDSSR